MLRIGKLQFAVWAVLSLLLPPFSVTAQINFGPNHPDVQDVVNRAVKSLEEMQIGTNNGRQTFAALTIVQASKRYQALVPKDHPIVKRAVARILVDVKADQFNVYSSSQQRELYYASLAVMLLTDLGPRKYREEIETIIDFLIQRKVEGGSFAYHKGIHPNSADKHDGDVSQAQFVCLALWVARQRGFRIDEPTVSKTLDWLLKSNIQPGTWSYIYQDLQPLQPQNSLSIHMAGLSSVYLLADYLNLSPVVKATDTSLESKLDPVVQLPPSVSIFRPGDAVVQGRPGAQSNTSVSKSEVNAVKGRGNRFLASNFQIRIPANNYYYLFALERYAYFREKAEGSLKEIPDWYDSIFAFMQGEQKEDGSFPNSGSIENSMVSTCFAILFLVRATETLVPPSGFSNLNGGQGLKENVRLDLVDGKVKTFDVVKGLDDIMELLDSDDIDEQQFELVRDSLAKSVAQLTSDKSKTRRQHLTYMRGLVSDRNYFKRLIAIKLLARQQDMDNVPALIYALGDPDLRICKEAHNGLRLISRKLDSITISDDPDYTEFQSVKNLWTEWFLRIRPGAELLD